MSKIAMPTTFRPESSGRHAPRATLIAYDIRGDQRRKRALRLIERFRCGGQKSMHECWLSISDAHSLAAELADVLDLSCDRALIAWPKLHAGIYCHVAKGGRVPFAALPSFPPARAAVLPWQNTQTKPVLPWQNTQTKPVLPWQNTQTKLVSPALPRGRWQLLAYDIVCTRRLQRVYGVLKKCAQHTQLSLFLLNLPHTQLQACVRSVRDMLKSEDDLRLYVVDAPELLWQIGCARQPGLVCAAAPPESSKPASLWQQLRTRFGSSKPTTSGAP